MTERIKGFIYSHGFVHCSVCVHKDATKEQIEEMVNTENPSGTQNGWKISTEPFKGGQPNPSPCEIYPERYLHYLMVC